MYEVLPNLYLSGYADAKRVPAGFWVINCTKDLPMVSGLGYRVPVDDAGRAEDMVTMAHYLPTVVGMIDWVLGKGDYVLVHCMAGQQRSCAVIAAYLMKHKRMTLQQAVDYLRSKKPDAFFGAVNFEEPLRAWEAACYIAPGQGATRR